MATYVIKSCIVFMAVTEFVLGSIFILCHFCDYRSNYSHYNFEVALQHPSF